MTIAPADREPELEQVRSLIAGLTEWDRVESLRLGLDAGLLLDFYYGAGEPDLPGPFAPPGGQLLLATHDGSSAGCIGFKRLTPEICEVKHLFVRPELRGLGIARNLAERLLAEATAAGYRVMRLETTTFMGSALALYASLGFQEREPYYEIPEAFLPVTVFMERDLGPA